MLDQNLRSIDHKKQSREFVKKNIPINTIIDIGTSKTTPVLNAVFKNKFHILFEPNQDDWDKIAVNYEKINHVLYKMPLFNKDVEVNMRKWLPNQGGNYRITEKYYPNLVKHNANKLDTVLKGTNYEKPYLIKLDVDGVELEILEGAQETLKDCSVIMIEVHPRDYLERCSTVEKYGFKLFDIIDLRYWSYKTLAQFDVIFVGKDFFKKFREKIMHDRKIASLNKI